MVRTHRLWTNVDAHQTAITLTVIGKWQDFFSNMRISSAVLECLKLSVDTGN